MKKNSSSSLKKALSQLDPEPPPVHEAEVVDLRSGTSPLLKGLLDAKIRLQNQKRKKSN